MAGVAALLVVSVVAGVVVVFVVAGVAALLVVSVVAGVVVVDWA